MGNKFLWLVYLLAVCSLLIYSYTQVDLNLTISGNAFYQSIQSILTQVGYFNRSLSTVIFIAITSLLHLSYFGLIYQAKKQLLVFSNTIKIVLITAFLLLFAYPAFSYDLFNYIFDTRILVHHHQNPYLFTALDFPDDLWTRFMHWTHRTYPYGPVWLVFTIPFYLLGMGKFVLTLLSYKLIGLVSYVVSIWAIKRIVDTTNPKLTTVSVVLFACNPLILIEFLVSAHIDSAMAMVLLLSLVWLLQLKTVKATLALFFSAGIKYLTVTLLPLLWLYRQKRIDWNQLITGSIVIMYLAVLLVITQREILPWYFITPFALTVLLPRHKVFVPLMLILTVASLLRYAPYLYFGDYSDTMKQTREILFFSTLALGSLVALVRNHVSSRGNRKPTKTK